jgi:hypothetical protein
MRHSAAGFLMAQDDAISSVAVTGNSPLETSCRGLLLPRLALVAIVLGTMVLPGDAPWINDEPLLFRLALAFNRGTPDHTGIRIPFTHATLGYVGLVGTRGARYGPVPVWIYQLFLVFTHDLVVMVVMRVAIFSGITAFALDWLARTMRLSPWLPMVVMLSPWIWIYSRQLWDNSFNIPLSTLVLAAYADFIARKKAWSLRAAVLGACLMPLIHLMSVALLVPLAFHLFFYQFGSLRRYVWSLAAIVVATQGLAWPYWHLLFIKYQRTLPEGHSPWLGFLYPLLGAHHLTATGLGNILGDDWFSAHGRLIALGFMVAQAITSLAYLAVLIGIVLAIPCARRVIKRDNPTVTDHLAFIALGTLLCQSLLDGSQRVYDGPHYFNATWIVYAIFVFISVDVLKHRIARGFIAPLLVPAYAIALVFVLLAMIVIVHHDGGTRTPGYGTVMSDQVDAVRQIEKLSDESIDQFTKNDLKHVSFQQWANYWWAFDVLRQMMPPPPGPRPDGSVIVHYRDAFVGDAHIVVEILPK